MFFTDLWQRAAHSGGHFWKCDCVDCSCLTCEMKQHRQETETKTCGDVEKRTRCMGEDMDNFYLPFFKKIPIQSISNTYICLLMLIKLGDVAKSGLTILLTCRFSSIWRKIQHLTCENVFSSLSVLLLNICRSEHRNASERAWMLY